MCREIMKDVVINGLIKVVELSKEQPSLRGFSLSRCADFKAVL